MKTQMMLLFSPVNPPPTSTPCAELVTMSNIIFCTLTAAAFLSSSSAAAVMSSSAAFNQGQNRFIQVQNRVKCRFKEGQSRVKAG